MGSRLKAGNTETTKTTTVKIDKTLPMITITSPLSGTVCLGCGLGTLTISFDVTDSVSGVGPVTAKIDGTVEVHDGDSIPLASLALGQHTLTVEARDAAGNTAEGSVSFQVSVTFDQLTKLVEQYYQEGLIDNQGIKNSLIKKLENAQAALGRGQPNVAKNILGAFVNEVQAQSGKHINATAASTLINCATLLANTL